MGSSSFSTSSSYSASSTKLSWTFLFDSCSHAPSSLFRFSTFFSSTCCLPGSCLSSTSSIHLLIRPFLELLVCSYLWPSIIPLTLEYIWYAASTVKNCTRLSLFLHTGHYLVFSFSLGMHDPHMRTVQHEATLMSSGVRWHTVHMSPLA